MPLIIGANSVSGYEVDNSLRFNSGSSDSLTRTPATTTNRKTFTISTWFKRSTISQTQFLFGTSNDNFVNSFFLFELKSGNELDITNYVSGINLRFITNQLFRDSSAWYHLVFSCDTTQATASNRVKIYLNGSQITSFGTETYPTQNLDTLVNLSTHTNTFSNASFGYNGYLAESYLIDGQALTPSSFGQTDTLTGIWIPKAYTGSFGTNGFYLEFKDSSALGDDTSGNGNDFTVNNLTSIDQTTDTPTNNFATLNPLDVNGMTLTEGNLLAGSTAATWKSTRGTIGISQGKWYWEMKATTATTAFDGQIGIGLFSLPIASNAEWTSANPSVVYTAGSGNYIINGVQTAYGATWTTGDIIGVAFDADNLTVAFYKNGASQGLISTGFSANTYTVEVAFFGRDGGTTSGSFNFGSPAFTISSGNSDANGYGNFEYAVPAGYYALCTENLAEYA
jgi:hypothetical protein